MPRRSWPGPAGSPACSSGIVAVALLGLAAASSGCGAGAGSGSGAERSDDAEVVAAGPASVPAGADKPQSPAVAPPSGPAGSGEWAGPAGPLDAEGFRALMEPFGVAAVAEHLQGVWVFSGGVNPIATAWRVDGTSFTLVNLEGATDEGELELLAPCKIAHVVRGGLSERANYLTMIATGDGVYRAGASMGLLRVEGFVVCTADGIIVGDRSGCARWRDVGGMEPRWERSPATCELVAGEGGTLRVRSESVAELTLTVYGELLLRWSPEESRGHEVAGLDAAVAAVKAANK